MRALSSRKRGRLESTPIAKLLWLHLFGLMIVYLNWLMADLGYKTYIGVISIQPRMKVKISDVHH